MGGVILAVNKDYLVIIVKARVSCCSFRMCGCGCELCRGIFGSRRILYS